MAPRTRVWPSPKPLQAGAHPPARRPVASIRAPERHASELPAVRSSVRIYRPIALLRQCLVRFLPDLERNTGKHEHRSRRTPCKGTQCTPLPLQVLYYRLALLAGAAAMPDYKVRQGYRYEPDKPSSTVLVTGVGDPESRWHGIDESLDLGMYEKACLAERLLLHGLTDPASFNGVRALGTGVARGQP